MTRPGPSALREHHHGKLVPMQRPEGEPSLLVGTGLLLLIAAAVWLGITSLSQPTQAAPEAVEQPASRLPQPPPVVGADRGKGVSR